jgi:hypothetical protein
MTDVARGIAGLVWCGGLLVLLALVWAVFVMAGRAGSDQEEPAGPV